MAKPNLPYIKIGLCLGSEPLKEFYFKPRSRITIGNSNRNSLYIPLWQKSQGFPFLKYTRKGYLLSLTGDMTGRFSMGGRTVSLEDLFDLGMVKKTKDCYQVFISDKIRGKFVFDDTKILLTFV